MFMSPLLITRYLNELHSLRKISGTKRETVVREAFKDLLKAWGKTRELQFIAEYRIVTAAKNPISVDGALLGIIDSATAARSNGFLTNTRKRRRKTQPSAKNSMPTASPITRIRSSASLRV
jgi:hypothetical protein